MIPEPPFFTYWPNDRIESTRGDTVQLWCGGRGIPAPRLTWWRRLNDSTVVEVKSDGRVLIADEALVFLNVMPKDEGVYYCNISSPLGTRLSNDAMLRVFGESDPISRRCNVYDVILTTPSSSDAGATPS